MKKLLALLPLLLLFAIPRAHAQLLANCENVPSVILCTPSGPANTLTGDALYVVGGKFNNNFLFIAPLWAMPANSVICNSLSTPNGIGVCTAGSGITISGGVISSSGGGSGAFNTLTGGTNTTASMIVGAGASITLAGSPGTIQANAFVGALPIANGGTAHTTLAGAGISTFSGTLTSGHCVQWSSTTGGQVDSGAACGSGGSSAFSSLTSSTNVTAAMVVGTGASLAVSGTGTIGATTVTGFSAASGKTLTASNSLTLTGTDSTSFAFPSTSDTVAGLAATQTFTNKSIAATEVNSGTLACAQMPALTGAISSAGNTCTTTGGSTSQRNVTTSDTLVIGDSNNVVYINCASACIETIPLNSSVAFGIPVHVDIYVDPASAVVTLAPASGVTLTFAPVNLTGSRTLAAGAIVKINKYKTTDFWNTTGTGET